MGSDDATVGVAPRINVMADPANVSLTLYVVGDHAPSRRAEARLRAVLEAAADLDWELDVVDLAIEPERAERDRILACPTVVRHQPSPTRRIIGDLGVPHLVREAIGLT